VRHVRERAVKCLVTGFFDVGEFHGAGELFTGRPIQGFHHEIFRVVQVSQNPRLVGGAFRGRRGTFNPVTSCAMPTLKTPM